jgi:hypothetical protein
MGVAALGHFQADVGDDLFEPVAFFGPLDGLQIGPQQLDLVLFQHAALGQRHGGVQARLAAQRGQQAVGPFLGDDLFDHFRRDRLDIRPVRQLRIGHDRRRVAVDQDYLVAFLAEHLAGLCPGIVKLTGLADDDRAGTDDQNLLDILAFWHSLSRFLIEE